MCSGDHEVRCVQRRILLEALANELPSGTIRFSSKVVNVEESGFYKIVHLADGTILRTKVYKFMLPFIVSYFVCFGQKFPPIQLIKLTYIL